MRRIDLPEQKRIMLRILRSVDEFCAEHDIAYQATYGTMLGAIRHGGFIPWDDDVDIAMARPDYERFYDLWMAQNDSEQTKLRLISYRDKSSIYPFFKIVDTRTEVVETYVDPQYRTGVWIDIFPIDPLSSGDEMFDLNTKVKQKYGFVIANTNEGTNAVRRLVKRVAKPILGRGDIYEIARDFDEKARYGSPESSDEIGIIVWGDGEKQERTTRRSLQTERVSFEDTTIPVPCIYHERLTQLFGDYMQLPPESDQHPHPSHASWLDGFENASIEPVCE